MLDILGPVCVGQAYKLAYPSEGFLVMRSLWVESVSSERKPCPLSID